MEINVNKTEVYAVLHTTLDWLSGLVPGAIGAAVAQSYVAGLTWLQRFVQLSIGIVTSYFVSRIAVELFNPGPFVLQGVSFTVGMVAYRAIPEFTAGFASTAHDAPRDVWGWLKGKFFKGSAK